MATDAPAAERAAAAGLEQLPKCLLAQSPEGKGSEHEDVVIVGPRREAHPSPGPAAPCRPGPAPNKDKWVPRCLLLAVRNRKFITHWRHWRGRQEAPGFRDNVSPTLAVTTRPVCWAVTALSCILRVLCTGQGPSRVVPPEPRFRVRGHGRCVPTRVRRARALPRVATDRSADGAGLWVGGARGGPRGGRAGPLLKAVSPGRGGFFPAPRSRCRGWSCWDRGTERRAAWEKQTRQVRPCPGSITARAGQRLWAVLEVSWEKKPQVLALLSSGNVRQPKTAEPAGFPGGLGFLAFLLCPGFSFISPRLETPAY
ncbi:uncharacterized protein LOC128571155 [Nycticebus coucang]|uniref:uncharacterized protein LOC128571155 n=1 Tax=Nycticebus coucang TaxID=9470 RepID=UPI00234C4F51|nr:uncharacterized protein LOC128571155 [Nycticebus coucang]